MRRSLVMYAAAAALLLAAACNGKTSARSPAASASPRTASVLLPSKLLGLDVVQEDVSRQAGAVREAYLDSLGLFSFREDKLLRATIQVGRFNEQAEPERKTFRNAIIAQLASVPQELRVGKKPVFFSSGREQLVFLWFDSKGFYVLSVRADYPFPRTLLRSLVSSRLLI